MGRGIKGIIFGGAVGAALGILYAPRAGKKTREMLAEKTEALWGEEAQNEGTILGEVAKTTKTAIDAGQSVIRGAAESPVGEAAKGVADKGVEFAKTAKDTANEFSKTNVRPVFSEKNDELRKKIDAARTKIAAQVAQNIDEDQNLDIKPASVKTKPAMPSIDESKEEAEKKAEKKTTKKVSSKKSTKKKSE